LILKKKILMKDLVHAEEAVFLLSLVMSHDPVAASTPQR